jgi:hypothetical protein
MAKFLNTSATNYFLEELIKDAKGVSEFLCVRRIAELAVD